MTQHPIHGSQYLYGVDLSDSDQLKIATWRCEATRKLVETGSIESYMACLNSHLANHGMVAHLVALVPSSFKGLAHVRVQLTAIPS